jgi:hypothetical protein
MLTYGLGNIFATEKHKTCLDNQYNQMTIELSVFWLIWRLHFTLNSVSQYKS